MYFEKNLEKLKNYDVMLYEGITADTFVWDENKVTSEVAKNGETILVYHTEDGRSEYLNSKYNPTSEAERFMEDAVALMEKATLVIIGLGNCAHVRQFIEKNGREHTHCIVYEPCVDIFMRVMHDIDISDIFELENVHFLVEGLNDVFKMFFFDAFINTTNVSTNKHIALPKYQKLFEKESLEFLKLIKQRYGAIQIEANTINKYGRQICYNSIQNICYLPGCRSGVDFIHAFPKNLPGIVVSAGPSLAKNVDLLKEAKGKAVIMVVDTAIRTVMSHGIIPDFVISIDNHKPVRLFEAEGLEKVPFLGEIAMNIDVLDKVKPERLIFYSADSLIWEDMFRKAGTDIRQLYVGGSVALDAMANFIEWGFKTIIMIGQDLMMTDNKVHVGEEEVKDPNKLAQRVVPIKDVFGNDGYTTMDYFTYIQEIEKLAERHSSVKFVDATEGGAFKQHTEIMSLREAIDTYCTEEYDVDALINSVPIRFVDETMNIPYDKLHEMRKNLLDMEKVLQKGVAACKDGERILKSKKYDIPRLKKINQTLAEVDDRYEHFHESVSVLKIASVAYYEFEDSFYAEEEDDIKEAIRMYSKAREYYNSMAEAIPQVVEIVDEALERWNKMYKA